MAAGEDGGGGSVDGDLTGGAGGRGDGGAEGASLGELDGGDRLVAGAGDAQRDVDGRTCPEASGDSTGDLDVAAAYDDLHSRNQTHGAIWRRSAGRPRPRERWPSSREGRGVVV
jgi:hypothetical protein